VRQAGVLLGAVEGSDEAALAVGVGHPRAHVAGPAHRACRSVAPPRRRWLQDLPARLSRRTRRPEVGQGVRGGPGRVDVRHLAAGVSRSGDAPSAPWPLQAASADDARTRHRRRPRRRSRSTPTSCRKTSNLRATTTTTPGACFSAAVEAHLPDTRSLSPPAAPGPPSGTPARRVRNAHDGVRAGGRRPAGDHAGPAVGPP
jgi:hypothetical protein